VSNDQCAQNTDSQLWREPPGDAYANSIHVTEGGSIGINVGGLVFVKTLAQWHALAEAAQHVAEPTAAPNEPVAPPVDYWQDPITGDMVRYPLAERASPQAEVTKPLSDALAAKAKRLAERYADAKESAGSASSAGLFTHDFIDVACIALPDGTVVWSDDIDTRSIDAHMRAWRESLAPHRREVLERAGVLGGVVIIRMIQEDYLAIPTTNRIKWPCCVYVESGERAPTGDAPLRR
jgi:hypothetical protein